MIVEGPVGFKEPALGSDIEHGQGSHCQHHLQQLLCHGQLCSTASTSGPYDGSEQDRTLTAMPARPCSTCSGVIAELLLPLRS